MVSREPGQNRWSVRRRMGVEPEPAARFGHDPKRGWRADTSPPASLFASHELRYCDRHEYALSLTTNTHPLLHARLAAYIPAKSGWSRPQVCCCCLSSESLCLWSTTSTCQVHTPGDASGEDRAGRASRVCVAQPSSCLCGQALPPSLSHPATRQSDRHHVSPPKAAPSPAP